MDTTKGFQLGGEIGGPMNLNEGYRWNVPVLTYGFDRAFLDYFGSNGVVAVESAMQLLNQLPYTGQLNLTNYPSRAWGMNYQGQALNLVDLKSTALSLLLEQLGLAKPEPNIFCIREIVTNGNSFSFAVIQRNFDPQTSQPSAYVNDTLFSYYIYQFLSSTNIPYCDAIEYLVDPMAVPGSAAAGGPTSAGDYAQQLSRDDVGGLRFLYSGNQIRFEQLLPDVHLVGGSTNLVRAAYRSGVEKITLVRQPAGTGGQEFKPVTNQWTDIYYIGSEVGYQSVERIMLQPDIVFSARDLGAFVLYSRTGTTNWSNNAGLNGNPGGAGPGVIAPGVTIAFNNVGRVLYNLSADQMNLATAVPMVGWGSYDETTNAVITYPSGLVPFQPSQVEFHLIVNARQNVLKWPLIGPAYGRFYFQMTTNLTTWQTLATLTNTGAAIQLNFTAPAADNQRYFRAIAE